jgi:hypothetical protein
VTPILLDSSVLVAFERMRTGGAGALRLPQARVTEWLGLGVQLLVPATSLFVARYECGGKTPELDWLLNGDPDLVLVVPLGRDAAEDTGAVLAEQRDGPAVPRGDVVEVEHLVWCSRGEDLPPAERWPIASYLPGAYEGRGVPVIPL